MKNIDDPEIVRQFDDDVAYIRSRAPSVSPLPTALMSVEATRVGTNPPCIDWALARVYEDLKLEEDRLEDERYAELDEEDRRTLAWLTRLASMVKRHAEIVGVTVAEAAEFYDRDDEDEE